VAYSTNACLGYVAVEYSRMEVADSTNARLKYVAVEYSHMKLADSTAVDAVVLLWDASAYFQGLAETIHTHIYKVIFY
jgi:hypothetical protein